MSLTVSETASNTYEPCPAGSYLARCARILDLGTQETDWQGQMKQQKKVLLAWEILDDEARRDDGDPFVLSKRYTASLHEKARLRQDLASWRGRDFTADELARFNLANVLGQPCMLSVVHASKDGRTFANIAAIMKAPKGAQVPEGEEARLLWDMTKPDWQVFARLPPRIVEQLNASPEYQALTPPESVSLSAPVPEQTSATDTNAFTDFEDDIPF